MPGIEVEKLLTERFWRDSSILGTSISDVRTMICQNKCSGHGVCNSETRACMCDTFWMPDVFYFWGIGPANCGESIFSRKEIVSRLLCFGIDKLNDILQIGPSYT